MSSPALSVTQAQVPGRPPEDSPARHRGCSDGEAGWPGREPRAGREAGRSSGRGSRAPGAGREGGEGGNRETPQNGGNRERTPTGPAGEREREEMPTGPGRGTQNPGSGTAGGLAAGLGPDAGQMPTGRRPEESQRHGAGKGRELGHLAAPPHPVPSSPQPSSTDHRVQEKL